MGCNVVSLETEIHAMYREIASYDGDFGDPIAASFSFDPWSYLEHNHLSEFERRGVIVAILVNLMSAIDNSTHADVVTSREGKSATSLANQNLAEKIPHFRSALEGFSQSEEAFSRALRPIYLEWVQPAVTA